VDRLIWSSSRLTLDAHQATRKKALSGILEPLEPPDVTLGNQQNVAQHGSSGLHPFTMPSAVLAKLQFIHLVVTAGTT
jgi:hypothetical protein